RLPLASVDVLPPSAMHTCGWLLLLSALACGRGRARRLLVAGGLSALACAGLEARAGVLPAGGVLVDHLDVGQGDSTLVATETDAWLVDAGAPPREPRGDGSGVAAMLPRRGVGALAAIVATHPQADHEGGLGAVAARLSVGEVWWNGAESRSRFHADLVATSSERGIPWRRLGAGDALAEAPVTVLGPPGDGTVDVRNDDSLVLRWSQGATSLLLPGDVEQEGEARVLRSGLSGAVLVRVPHHGSRTSSSIAFVERLRPAVVVAGTGHRNRFGHPSAEVRERWRSRGALWLETAVDGEVVVRGDGQLLTVETCRSDAGSEPDA
ncbi:MAG: ComEC/Rec2 family competence protein, partial [Alphaproteobacteria bacterium]